MSTAEGKRTSQGIGAAHERVVRELLDRWAVRYISKPRYRTRFGSVIELDFVLPEANGRQPIVVECKDFAVEAKSPSDSKRRKMQEALWLLIQVKRYCPETQGARLVLITGAVCFQPQQEALLRAELGEDLSIPCITDIAELQRVIGGPISNSRVREA